MAVFTWDEDPKLGASKCQTARESWQCPNMINKDSDMDGESYACAKCGRTERINYDDVE